MTGFNPLEFQGKRWMIDRDRTGFGFSGTYWVEIDRNKAGRVTLIAADQWDNRLKDFKGRGHWTTIERQMDEIEEIK